MSKSTRHSLRKLIANGNTQEAILFLFDISVELSDKNWRNKITLISARFNNYKSSVNKKLLAKEDQYILLNEINNSLLELIEEIPENHLNSDSISNNDSRKSESIISTLFKWSNILLFIISVAILIVGIVYYSFLSITVTSENGNDITILNITPFWISLVGMAASGFLYIVDEKSVLYNN